jgi:dihydrofolate reductase
MAATREGVVGDKGGLPWNYPDELEAFRAATAGYVCIMGRVTYEGIPDPFFMKRQSIIVTGNQNLPLRPNTEIISSIEHSIRRAQSLSVQGATIFMIGGARLAESFLKANLLGGFILTRIHKDYKGDCRMDLNLMREWRTVSFLKETADYRVEHLAPPGP